MVKIIGGIGIGAEGSEHFNYTAAAIKHVTNNPLRMENYDVVTLLEQFEQGLEILECSFPTFFANASAIYKSNNRSFKQNVKKGKTNPAYQATIFTNWVRQICRDSDDSLIYDLALNISQQKLRAIHLHGEKCCAVGWNGNTRSRYR